MNYSDFNDNLFANVHISLLFIHENDLETFNILFTENKSHLDILALIKSGWMNSDNYDKDGWLAKAVLNNLFGCPECVIKYVNHSKATVSF